MAVFRDFSGQPEKHVSIAPSFLRQTEPLCGRPLEDRDRDGQRDMVSAKAMGISILGPLSSPNDMIKTRYQHFGYAVLRRRMGA